MNQVKQRFQVGNHVRADHGRPQPSKTKQSSQTALWLMNLTEDEWARVQNEVHRYGIALARKMGPIQKPQKLNDDEWDYQNAKDEQDWCLPRKI